MSVRRFPNHIKRVPNFRFQYSKVRGCNRLFRIDHNVHVGAIPDGLQSKCFPQPSLHTIPLHRAAQHFANGKPDAQALTLRALQAKNCHMLREVPAALLVYTFKIRAAKQARAVGKFHPLPRTRSTPWGDGVHRSRSENSRLFELISECYSRKPGFTETRFRPLARRREITAWPPAVFIRLRNPCV